MFSRGFPIAALLLAALLAAGCQSTPPPTYGQLHDKATHGEPVPVAALRDAFRRDVALPRMLERLVDLEQQALQLVEDEPLKLGSIGSAILDTYQASITGHYVLTRFYDVL